MKEELTPRLPIELDPMLHAPQGCHLHVLLLSHQSRSSSDSHTDIGCAEAGGNSLCSI